MQPVHLIAANNFICVVTIILIDGKGVLTCVQLVYLNTGE